MGGKWDRHESVGGWGYRTRLTESQQAEIGTCLDCPLPDCVGITKRECPLYDQEAQMEAVREKHRRRKERRKERTRQEIQDLIHAWWTKSAMSDN